MSAAISENLSRDASNNSSEVHRFIIFGDEPEVNGISAQDGAWAAPVRIQAGAEEPWSEFPFPPATKILIIFNKVITWRSTNTESPRAHVNGWKQNWQYPWTYWESWVKLFQSWKLTFENVHWVSVKTAILFSCPGRYLVKKGEFSLSSRNRTLNRRRTFFRRSHCAYG